MKFIAKMKKRVLTWANFWTVVSLTLGVISYFKFGKTMGNLSMATGALAFWVGL